MLQMTQARPEAGWSRAASAALCRHRSPAAAAGTNRLAVKKLRMRRPVATATSPEGGNGHSWMSDDIQARPPHAPSPLLYSDDLAPVLASQRTFSAWDMAALWIGLVVSVSSWFLAGGLVELGMSWRQGVACVFVANLLVLVPMVLVGAAGVKYGVPFPVLARSSFGVHGAVLPAVLRGCVAAGWFGLNTWLGGAAIHQMMQTVMGSAMGGAAVIGWLGITQAQGACFLAFWAMQVWILLAGMEGIRRVEAYSAPVLIALTAALLAWAVNAAGGFGPMLAAPSQFAPGMPKHGQFWSVFLPSLSAQIGYWATLSLNIPDFTRYAKSQRAQVLGQAIGLPLFMAAFTFCGLAVTSATVVLYGAAISDPIALLSKVEGVWAIALALLGLVLATLTTNIAANVVAPANALIALDPARFTFARGALLTSVVGLLIKPWRLVQSTGDFFFKWLIGYSVVLGPIAGILVCDYYLVRGRQLDLDALYSAHPAAAYYYRAGWNPAALAALAAGALPTLPGFLHTLTGAKVPQLFVHLYSAAWFVGFLVGGAVYWLLMRRQYWLQAQEALVGAAA